MAAGLQVWDAAGHLIVDLTSRLARILGSRYIDGTAGSLYDAGLLQGQGFVAFQHEKLFIYSAGQDCRPTITISGGTIAWSYSGEVGQYSKKVTGYMFYGVR